MKKELAKIYEPQKVEDEIYKSWEESGFFNPDNFDGEPYSIMMPPPNVTGVLHLGHSLENSLMDLMARFQRMNGKKVLLLPGTDHAAVATQAKVEKLLVEKGIKNPREELGREKLLEEIRNYAENSKSTILKQIRKMGTSCDWSRLAYTFDEKRNKAVNEVFVRMYNDKLIYRGHRVINWSVKGQSTCSDDELEYKERTTKLYTFKYSKDFPISIATTRPETKLGDTAVAVNPNDKRYKKYIGQVFTVEVGAAKQLEIKIIADENVEQEFGTGALGVTPAHSAIDFEMYEKQKAKDNAIGIIQVIGIDGKMTANAGSGYAGLAAEDARKKFVEWLKKNNLLEKEEEITQSVGTSDRFGDVVEALPMTQWFVDVNKKIPSKEKSLKELMHDAVAVGHNGDPKQKITITPERFEKLYFNWIEDLRDWCISRQIWWGHQIPAWIPATLNIPNDENRDNERVRVSVEKINDPEWVQDPDTLDTWFSSGLWTFSTLGWPKETKDLKTFHPSSWMQMGHELLFFWMARMILMSTYSIDQIPFKDVYIHGILRDEKGKKFSKSLGNAIDPLEIVGKYGCDALRLSLVMGISPGNDARFYEEKVESSRNFVNKLWNIARYILSSTQKTEEKMDIKNFTLADDWIYAKYRATVETVTENVSNFKFSQAAETLRDFTWNDFADWYVEISKFEDNKKEKQWMLNDILEGLLKLWHPFIPFVTEAIWKEMGNKDLLMVRNWPQSQEPINQAGEIRFDLIKEIIISIRNGRLENNIEPGKKIKVIIDVKNQPEYLGIETEKLIKSQENILKSLRTGINDLEIVSLGEKMENAIQRTVGGINIHIPLEDLVDVEKEKTRLKKEIENIKKFITGLKSRLENKDFISKAPKQIIDQQKESLSRKENELQELRKHLKSLK
jgi:valyl-tRNA synthetase